MAIQWDEGYTLGREERFADWFRALRDPARFAAEWQPRPPDGRAGSATAAPPTTPPAISSILVGSCSSTATSWPGSGRLLGEEPHGHPPFYALIGLTGDLLAPSWRDCRVPSGADPAL